MKKGLLALALAIALLAPRAARASTVSVAIRPGPLAATLSRDGDRVVLTVDDATGSGSGWWVSVACGCSLVAIGDPVALVGQPLDHEGGPALVGATLMAAPGHGMGVYRVAFEVAPGAWSVTSTQGSPP